MLTVGAVIREPLQTTLAFVSWYLEQGADQIVLCFDDVDDPAIDYLDPLTNVKCFRATDELLQSVGMDRTRRFVRRQNKIVQSFYREQSEGWFLHVDGDELLYLDERTLAQELEQTPDNVRGVTFRPAEHLNTPDTKDLSHFRLLMSPTQLEKVYGEDNHIFRRRAGLTGHHIGKTATRSGFSEAQMRQHCMHYGDKSLLVDRELGADEGAYLLHFVDQGYEHWRRKLPWRMNARGFDRGLRRKLNGIMLLSDPEPKLEELYRILHVFGSERRELLDREGLLLSLDLSMEDIVGQNFSNLDAVPAKCTHYAAI